jgi:CHASE1-domain containing sensor protein
MNGYESSSMFGTLLGAGIGFLVPGGGLLGAAIGGSLLGGLFGSFGSQREQTKQQERLAKAQIEQSNLLREKIKADNAGLYSSAQSVIAQRSGTMGAIY